MKAHYLTNEQIDEFQSRRSQIVTSAILAPLPFLFLVGDYFISHVSAMLVGGIIVLILSAGVFVSIANRVKKCPSCGSKLPSLSVECCPYCHAGLSRETALAQAPAHLKEIEHHVQTWTMEPELNTSKPRNIATGNFPRALWLIFILPLFLFILFMRLGEHAARLYILNFGVTKSTKQFENVDTRRHL